MRIDQFESADRKDDGDRPWRKFATPVNKKPADPNNPNNRGPINHDEWNKSAKPVKEEGDSRKDDRPWRKDGTPLNKPPSNPNNPNNRGPINHDEWMKSSKPMEEDTSEMPEAGDTIRTNKSEMDGKVDRIEGNVVFFRIADGRLMKTGLNNVTVVQKLADGDSEIMEDELDEVSNELLAKYKTAAGKSASDADKQGDYKTGDKRFKGIVKATNKQFDNDKKSVKEGPNDGSTDNFTADDIKRLEQIQDLPTIKAQAKELIKGKAARRMKPEKIAYFYDKIDSMAKPIAIVKLMYDLLLSGEGNAVVGTRNSMGQNSYRSRFGEGGMGGINRSAPSNDVSYEKMLDEVYGKWNEEQAINELSVDTMRSYTQAANKTSNIQQRPLRKVVKTVRGVKQANDKIDTRTGKGRAVSPNSGTNEDCWDDYKQVGMKDKGGKQVPNCVPDTNEALDPWQGYTKDDKKANAQAKAPKSAKQGTAEFRMSDMIKDGINVHGVKWAFDYYVKKHGMPPRQFQILAGLTADKAPAKKQLEPLPQERGMQPEPEKQSWWKKLRGKLPFEE